MHFKDNIDHYDCKYDIAVAEKLDKSTLFAPSFRNSIQSEKDTDQQQQTFNNNRDIESLCLMFVWKESEVNEVQTAKEWCWYPNADCSTDFILKDNQASNEQNRGQKQKVEEIMRMLEFASNPSKCEHVNHNQYSHEIQVWQQIKCVLVDGVKDEVPSGHCQTDAYTQGSNEHQFVVFFVIEIVCVFAVDGSYTFCIRN